jgi:hypothetical protein
MMGYPSLVSSSPRRKPWITNGSICAATSAGKKMALPDIVIMLRRGADEMDAGLHADNAQGERQARRGAAAGNAARPGDTWSSASGI